MAHQGKFDALTKELISHVLGFKENEENFVRSEQYVLSNLLYHHCLAVNSHAMRRSLDGLGLKFTVHGQQNRAQRLSELTSKFLSSPVFKDHYEMDIEWSLISLLLHLSNSPTQVPETEAELHPVVIKTVSPASSQEQAEEQIDWVAYLLKGEKECDFGPEDPLSDWSDSDEEDYLMRSRKDTDSYKSYIEEELCIRAQPRSKTKDWKMLEQSHRARSWVSGNTHLTYWKGTCYQHEAFSSRLVANVASVWEEAKKKGGERSQLLSEWAMLREILWLLMCPMSSYIFQRNEAGDFVVRNRITLPSLTAGATSKLLEEFCTPLKQLSELYIFIQNFEVPESDPPTPVTLLAYVTGLQLWRRRFQAHLSSLENIVKKQETTCTLVWLKDELNPWLRILSSIYAVHYTAVTAYPEDSSRSVALRLIGSLCEGVEGAGDRGLRCVLLRLLLHTLRHYFSIMHNWLLYGSLVDFADEFIIERNESVGVMDELFWKEAFLMKCHPDSQDLAPGDPLRTGLKILIPLAVALTCIGKSQELLSALTLKPFQDEAVSSLTSSRIEVDAEKTLGELFVEHVSENIAESQPLDDNLNEHLEGEDLLNDVCKVGEDEDSSKAEEDSLLLTVVDQHLADSQKQKDVLYVKNILDVADPMLSIEWNTCGDENECYEHKNTIDRKIEAIEDVPRAVSVVAFLSSSMRPLITEKQNKLNAELTERLVREYHLDRHCRAVRSILLLEAGDIMHEFYSHLFTKLDHGESLDSISLTLHLEYCVARLYPDLAKLFSVSVEAKGSDADGNEEESKEEPVPLQTKADTTTQQLSSLGLPNISIHYQAPWPMNLVFTQEVMKKFNMLFRFSLSLKRATTGLERLKFKDMASWNALVASGNESEESDSPLQSRLHRLHLLRLWLLCFARELHNYFANVVFLPYNKAFEDLIESKPPFSAIIADHGKLLNRVLSLCLMGNEAKMSFLQVVLNKVFWLTQQLGHLWMKDIGRVSNEELSSLELQYVRVHRYIVNLLTHLTTTRFLPHLEGLARTLANTVPLLTH